MSFERNYIKQHFPDYDYRRPVEPWRLNYHAQENRLIVNFQLQAFVYWWAIHTCQEEALVGLALSMLNIPYCISTWEQQGEGAVFVRPEGVHLIFNKSSFPLIVASAPLFSMSCPMKQDGKICDDLHVVKTMQDWGKILTPGGMLIATVPDAGCALQAGINIERDMKNITHAWSARRFSDRVLSQLNETFIVEEFDTLKNNFAFNIVLTKK